MNKAVLLMAYGGPDSLDDIEPYLLDIRGGRPTSHELVEEIRERYAQIGGRSPLLEITCAQAAALERYMNRAAVEAGNREAPYRVYVGMRHWKPYIRDVVAQIAADGYQSGIALCMAPHASKMSTGAYLQKLREAQEALQTPGAPQPGERQSPGEHHSPLEMDFIDSWYDQRFLIQALAGKIRASSAHFPAEEQKDIFYLFTAHSLPAVIVEQGDPYADQLMQTARLLAQELELEDGQWMFGYQSAGAAGGRWLGPSIEEILPELAKKGIRNVLVTPVGFVADHVEILYDLDIEAQAIAKANGIRLVRSESMNASPDFIEGLGKLIIERLALKQDGSS